MVHTGWLTMVAMLALASCCWAANPKEPRTQGARRLDEAPDCNGPVAFSGVGSPAANAAKPGLLTFEQALTDRGVGWNPSTGQFTCHCPGIYQLGFSAAADKDARLSLRLKPKGKSEWKTLLATGAGGGSGMVLVDMDVGDQAAVWLDSGKLDTATGAAPTTSFIGLRVAKKN